MRGRLGSALLRLAAISLESCIKRGVWGACRDLAPFAGEVGAHFLGDQRSASFSRSSCPAERRRAPSTLRARPAPQSTKHSWRCGVRADRTTLFFTEYWETTMWPYE